MAAELEPDDDREVFVGELVEGRHYTVLGPTRSGKSFFVADVLDQLREQPYGWVYYSTRPAGTPRPEGWPEQGELE